MLNAVKILELATQNDTAAIIALAEKEITEAAAKAAGGNTLLQRTRAAEKYIADCPEPRRGAWMGKGKQIFTNGYTAFLLSPAIEGLQRAEDCAVFPVEKCIPSTNEYTTETVDPKEIKARLKIWGAEHPHARKRHDVLIVQIANSDYDARFILDCYNILGGSIVFQAPPENGHLSPAVLTSENGMALLMPTRHNPT